MATALVLGASTAAAEARPPARDHAASSETAQGGAPARGPARAARRDGERDGDRHDNGKHKGHDRRDDPAPPEETGDRPAPGGQRPGADPAPAGQGGGSEHAAAAPASREPPAAAPECTGADRQAGAARLARVRAAVRCLIAAERALAGLPPLRVSGRLHQAGTAHARDMVRHAYFAHEDRRGRHVARRVRPTGWFPGRGRWLVGETLAWGRGHRSTPRAIVEALLASPTHRAVLLHPKMRELGVGATFGTPRRRRERGVTFAIVLGRRDAGSAPARGARGRRG